MMDGLLAVNPTLKFMPVARGRTALGLRTLIGGIVLIKRRGYA